jgi:hypothetical protein
VKNALTHHALSGFSCCAESPKIANVDEACCRADRNGLLTWTPMGAQNIRLWLEGNKKDSLLIVFVFMN